MHGQLLNILRRERDLADLETGDRGLLAALRALKVEEKRYQILTPQSSLLTTVWMLRRGTQTRTCESTRNTLTLTPDDRYPTQPSLPLSLPGA